MSRQVSEDEHQASGDDNQAENEIEVEEENNDAGNESGVDGNQDNEDGSGASGDDDNDENETKSSSKNKRMKSKGNGKGKMGRGRPSGNRNKGRDNRYRVYIFKILQQVHPNVGITKTGMDIINSFIEDMFEQICNEAMKLCHFNKTSTITAREISTATKLILPAGELQKHAVLEGEKAVEDYTRNSKSLQEKRLKARGGKKGVWPGGSKQIKSQKED